MQTRLRPAEEADLPAITEIYAHAVIHGTATYELDPPDTAEMTARYRALTEMGLPYLVAETGEGAIAGYAYAGPFRTRPAYRFIVEDSIYIRPESKGRGIGRALLDALLDESRALGFRQMVAVIGDGEKSVASVKLHEAAGFSHSGMLYGSGHKHGRWLDTVFMQIALNGGTAQAPESGSFADRLFSR